MPYDVASFCVVLIHWRCSLLTDTPSRALGRHWQRAPSHNFRHRVGSLVHVLEALTPGDNVGDQLQ
jgi:hypothetical protein